MADISTVRTDLLSIVGNNRLPIKTKRILIKRGLKAINTFINLKPNKIYNQKKRKINKILSLLPSIKYNVDLKKLLTKELIIELTDFEKKKDDKNTLPNKEMLIETTQVESEDSEKSNESLNSDSDTEEGSDCDEDSDDEDSDDEDSDDEDSDNENSDNENSENSKNSETDELDNTVNNLVEDAKSKLIIKLTKYKLEHEYNMEAEKNRNMERMEELALNKLKIKNKYKLKKLENRK